MRLDILDLRAQEEHLHKQAQVTQYPVPLGDWGTDLWKVYQKLPHGSMCVGAAGKGSPVECDLLARKVSHSCQGQRQRITAKAGRAGGGGGKGHKHKVSMIAISHKIAGDIG
jgi:hypothetical protein